MAHSNCPSQSPIPPPESWFSESSPSQALQCHRALQYPDILHAIFDHLDPGRCTEDRRLGVSAALVCRSFSEFASRALWRRMYDLHHLWRVLLTEDIPFGCSIEVFQSILRTKGYQDPTGWARFLVCAARIRSLASGVVQYVSDPEIELRLIRAIHHHNNGETFLPSLRELETCVTNRPGADDLILISLGLPSLDRLKIVLRGTATLLPNHNDLIQRAPLLRHLIVKGDYILKANDPIVQALLGFQYLHSFQANSFGFNSLDLQRLASSLTLEELQLDIAGFEFSNTKIDLPRIRKLSPSGQAEDITALVARLQAPVLVYFGPIIEFQRLAPAIQCIRRIAESSFGARLCSLKIMMNCFINPESPPTNQADADNDIILLSSVLQPCFSMPVLEDLQFFGPMFKPYPCIIMTDDDIPTITRGLKRLRRLTIGETIYLRGPLPPQITGEYVERRLVESAICAPDVTILQHFALHCPHLVALQLDSFYINVPRASLSLPQQLNDNRYPSARTPSAQHPLRVLEIWHLSQDYHVDIDNVDDVDTVAVAEYLDALFPHLDITHMQRFTTYYENTWKTVLDKIAARQRSRW